MPFTNCHDHSQNAIIDLVAEMAVDTILEFKSGDLVAFFPTSGATPRTAADQLLGSINDAAYLYSVEVTPRTVKISRHRRDGRVRWVSSAEATQFDRIGTVYFRRSATQRPICDPSYSA